MPTPPRPRQSPDAIATIHAVVREVFAGAEKGDDLCATYELEDDDAIWVQVTRTQINMAYPYDDEPMPRVVTAAVEHHERLTLCTWEPNLFATFDFDPKASSREIARLVDQLFLHVLHVTLDEIDDYALETTIACLEP